MITLLDYTPFEISTDIINCLEPTFKLVLARGCDARRKGELTCDQRKRLRAAILEKESGALWTRRQSKKRFR